MYYGIFDMATLEIYFVDFELLWIVLLWCLEKLILHVLNLLKK